MHLSHVLDTWLMIRCNLPCSDRTGPFSLPLLTPVSGGAGGNAVNEAMLLATRHDCDLGRMRSKRELPMCWMRTAADANPRFRRSADGRTLTRLSRVRHLRLEEWS